MMADFGKKMALAAVLASSAGTAAAFAPTSMIRPPQQLNMATVDPDTITKMEYQDICGIDFNEQTLEQRLQRTSFLYPKHVEVIEDLSPIADEMVSNIVSLSRRKFRTFPMTRQLGSLDIVIRFFADAASCDVFGQQTEFLRTHPGRNIEELVKSVLRFKLASSHA
jgi:hypothetical protein